MLNKYLTVTFLSLLLLIFPSEGFATTIDLGSSYNLGAVESQTLSLSVNTEIQRLISLYMPGWGAIAELDDPITLSTEIQYSEAQNDIVKNNGFFRAGYDPGLSENWSLWFYEEIGYNHIAGTDVENFVGGGGKYKFFKNVSASFGCLYHYMETEEVESIGRWSLRLKAKNAFGGVIIFYQPDMVDFEDYILKGEAYVRHKLDEVFFLKLSVKDQYRTSWDKNEFSSIFSVGMEF